MTPVDVPAARHDDSALIVELSDGVLTMTLNRPGARNALSPQLLSELDAAFDLLERGDARVGVLTGAGSAFCAGLDLKIFASAGYADRDAASRVIHRAGRLAKPIIGAVNGATVTGGLELALGCDFLIGSPRAVFADTHATVGAFPGGGLTARLAPVVGARTAKAMSLAALRLDAWAARRAGLLAEIVDEDALVGRAQELAQRVAAADPEYVGSLRRLHDHSLDCSMGEALANERAAQANWRAAHRVTWTV